MPAFTYSERNELLERLQQLHDEVAWDDMCPEKLKQWMDNLAAWIEKVENKYK